MALYLNINKLEREFISITNHTFRTPLTGILWATKELEKEMTQKEKLVYLQNINNSTARVMEVVDILVGIKSISDRSSYNFEATSIREIIEASINKYREEINKRGLAFQVSTFKGIPLLTMDLKKISFVIDTLLENAIYYTPNNGKILIDCIPYQDRLTIFISDTGIGLSLLDRIQIFSKFYRSRRALLMNPNSMGLRLYLSKQIIERHHGKIYAKSRGKDKGTTFFVELPIKKR